jgi:hypothetical protein
MPVLYAVAAIVPLWAQRAVLRRMLMTAGVLVFAGIAMGSVRQAVDAQVFQPGPSQDLPPLITALEQHGLSRGYASYWDAMPLTWHSDGALFVVDANENPLNENQACGEPQATTLCPTTEFTVTSWYKTAPGTSFVVVDPAEPYLTQLPSARYGTPASQRVGRFTVLVYPYDIAKRMTWPPKYGASAPGN